MIRSKQGKGVIKERMKRKRKEKRALRGRGMKTKYVAFYVHRLCQQ